jgi:hypothetical protein
VFNARVRVLKRAPNRGLERFLLACSSLVPHFLPASGAMPEPLGGFATLARRASR